MTSPPSLPDWDDDMPTIAQSKRSVFSAPQGNLPKFVGIGYPARGMYLNRGTATFGSSGSSA
jgi:hypothetical protein